jgi:hypothetical protein
VGIGLSISRSIIESHKGQLWASANDGPGATFGFHHPLRLRRGDRHSCYREMKNIDLRAFDARKVPSAAGPAMAGEWSGRWESKIPL